MKTKKLITLITSILLLFTGIFVFAQIISNENNSLSEQAKKLPSGITFWSD